jgi:hypothetical protein
MSSDNSDNDNSEEEVEEQSENDNDDDDIEALMNEANVILSFYLPMFSLVMCRHHYLQYHHQCWVNINLVGHNLCLLDELVIRFMVLT